MNIRIKKKKLTGNHEVIIGAVNQPTYAHTSSENTKAEKSSPVNLTCIESSHLKSERVPEQDIDQSCEKAHGNEPYTSNENMHGTTPASVSEFSVTSTGDPEGFSENVDTAVNLETFWPAFLEHLIQQRPNLGSFLSLAYAQPEGTSGISLKFSSSYRFQYLEVIRKNNRSEIQNHLIKFAGRPLNLNITVEANGTQGHEPNYIKTIGNISSTIDDEIEREPIIKKILDFFDGEVLD